MSTLLRCTTCYYPLRKHGMDNEKTANKVHRPAMSLPHLQTKVGSRDGICTTLIPRHLVLVQRAPGLIILMLSIDTSSHQICSRLSTEYTLWTTEQQVSRHRQRRIKSSWRMDPAVLCVPSPMDRRRGASEARVCFALKTRDSEIIKYSHRQWPVDKPHVREQFTIV